MTTPTEFQSFSPVTQTGLVPSQELALWMREVVTILREIQATQADHEARLTAQQAQLTNHEARLTAGGL